MDGPPISRRRLLGSVGVAAVLPLAGCVLEPPVPTVGPIDCPDKPRDITRQRVREWLPSFERALAWNHALREFGARELTEPDFEVTGITVTLADPGLEARDDGYLAWFDTVSIRLTFEHERGGGYHHSEFVVSYFVSATQFLRAAGDELVDPREVHWAQTPVCRM